MRITTGEQVMNHPQQAYMVCVAPTIDRRTELWKILSPPQY